MKPPVRKPYVKTIAVGPEDIDAQGHVSNVKILDWANQAAIEHSELLGFDVPRYEEIGGIFVVRRHEIDYHAPAYQSDTLTLFTWPSAHQRSVAERRHEIHREADGALIAKVLTTWVYVDTKTGRPKRMPPEVTEAFNPANFL